MNGLLLENFTFHDIGPVTIAVDRAECVGLTGPSGAGKTLFLRAVADLDDHGGELYLDGIPAARMPPYLWRRQVGLLPAESAWWRDRVGPHFPAAVEPAWTEALGFGPDVMDWEVSRLSSGERQRLSLLRLLANRPQVLLLDEPTTNLDPVNVVRVETLLDTYRKEAEPAMLWVSHDRRQIERVATRFLRLDHKSLIET